MQLRAVPSTTGCHFLKYALAAGRLEGAELRRVALIVPLRDAGIAEQHSCQPPGLGAPDATKQDTARQVSPAQPVPSIHSIAGQGSASRSQATIDNTSAGSEGDAEAPRAS